MIMRTREKRKTSLLFTLNYIYLRVEYIKKETLIEISCFGSDLLAITLKVKNGKNGPINFKCLAYCIIFYTNLF